VLVIADHLAAEGVLDLLLVAPEPQACRAAEVAVRTGRVRAVLVAPDELDILLQVIACLDDAVYVIGSVAIELAEKLPPLSDRDVELLSGVASGEVVEHRIAPRIWTGMPDTSRSSPNSRGVHRWYWALERRSRAGVQRG
jgi:hypothetical protein